MDQQQNLIQTLQQTVAAQTQTIQQLQVQLSSLKKELDSRFRDVVIRNSMVMGRGATAFHADQQGFWWGQNTFDEIVAGATGVAIGMDGAFYQNP